MIVLLNVFPLPFSEAMAASLAARYGDEGGWLDLHRKANQPGLLSRDNMPDLLPDDAVAQQVSQARQQGRVHLVLHGTFLTPEALRRLRVCLSAHDDEIYAFRLPMTESLLRQLANESRDAGFSEAYQQWADAQDAGARRGDMGYAIPIESTDPGQTAGRIWDDIHAPVELVEYNPEWPALFAAERDAILAALPESGIQIEHIGSTAIPGLPAKPILDILILVERLDDAVGCIQPLRELGYAFIDYPQNTDRRFFRKGEPRSHHIHIVARGSRSADAHLRFRDALLNDATLRQEYLDVKRDAMLQFTHRRALYGERKSALIRKALA